MLIDTSYFTAGPRQIMNVTLGNGTTREKAVLEQYIAEYQPEFLSRVLGAREGEAMNGYLEAIDRSYDAVRDEARESVCAKLRKPFADYVFYHVLRDSGQSATVTGVVRLKCANQYVEPIMRQVATWNRMANSLNLFAEWVDAGECPVAADIDPYLLEAINRFNL